MTPERWEQIREIFDRALESEDRETVLAEACKDDADLRREVESLLKRCSASEDPVLDRPVWLAPGGLPPSLLAEPRQPAARMPAKLGKYRILSLIGEGGMGSVYEAEQEQPHRRVALKVVKAGCVSTELLRRFELEAETLARLQHPGIAQIYEAGTADEGFGPQPYFAMEYIHGHTLRDFVGDHAPEIRQRLELMTKVCDAVEHAHQRGIVHRDLKPGNILVDSGGQPKVVDFGVARVTDGDAQISRQTDLGQLVGTLAYMSPEQALGDPLALDTRSDIYALGVILYELLAGRLPYPIGSNLPEAVHTIQEVDPPPLSSINRSCRGDIETIVAKALEKDKTRRYASASALAEDIRRHLKEEPILAAPASASYLLQKFAKRHKALVSSVALVLLVLAGGIVASSVEAVRARRAERVAVNQRDRADTEAATSRAVVEFLQNDVLAQADPGVQAGPETKPDPDLRVRTALDRAAARIAGKFTKQPLVEASIRQTIAQTYEDLGLFPQAQQQQERALELRRRELGESHPDTLRAMSFLATLFQDQDKAEEAEPLLTKTLEIQRRVLGAEHPDTLFSMNNLASYYRDRGKNPQAEPLAAKVLEVRRRTLGDGNRDTLASMDGLALTYANEGKYSLAEPLFERALEIARQLGGDEHPDTLLIMNDLAALYTREGKYDRAEPLYSSVLATQRRVLGAHHPDTLTTMGNLAALEENQHRYAQAEQMAVEVLDSTRQVLGEKHYYTLLSMNNLASIYYHEGKYARAKPLYKTVLATMLEEQGEEHPSTLSTMASLAQLYTKQGEYAQAEPLFSRTLKIERRVLGEEHPSTLTSMNGLAVFYRSRGDYGRAEPLFMKTLEIERRVLGEEHPSTLNTMSGLATLYAHQGRYAQAELFHTKAMEIRRRVLGPQHPETADSMADLGAVVLEEQKYADAEPLLRGALDVRAKANPGTWTRYYNQVLLGACLAGQKKYQEAEALLVSGYEGMVERKTTIPSEDRPVIQKSAERIVRLYEDLKRPDKSTEWRNKLPQE